MRAAALVLSATALMAAATSGGLASAQETPPSPAKLPARGATVALDGKRVLVSFSYRDVVDAEITRKLQSGLPTVITMRGAILREAGGEPVAPIAKSCRVVYDLWDEVFRIDVKQRDQAPTAIAVNVEGVLRICAEARRLTAVERAVLRKDTRYFIAALVEVNPISPEVLDRIKRWVSRPSGAAPTGPGDSLFGSFVGLFVTRVETAERRLAFRTHAFVPPNPS